MKAKRSHWRCIVFLTGSLVLSSAGLSSPPSSPPDWFWGCWTVKKLLPVTDVSGLSSKQETAIIGSKLVFSKACARWRRTVIHLPKYSLKRLSAKEFFEGYYVPLRQIGVQEPYVVQMEVELPENLSDLDFPGATMYLRKNDIVIEVEGDYFAADRAKPSADCSCHAKDGASDRKG